MDSFPLWLQSRQWGANVAKSPDSTQDTSLCLFYLHGDGPLAVSAPSYIHDVPLQTSISVTQPASPCPSLTSSSPPACSLCAWESVCLWVSCVLSTWDISSALHRGNCIAEAPTPTHLLLGRYEFYVFMARVRSGCVSACVLSLWMLCTWIVSVSEQVYLMEGKIATARALSWLLTYYWML